MFDDIEREVKESELPHALAAFVANSPYLYELTIAQLRWMKNNGKASMELFVSAMLSRGNMATEPTRLWYEKGGVIYFSVTSDGTTGEDWNVRLESKDFRTDDHTKRVFRLPDFKPTSGVTEVAVFKGMFFEANDRTTKNIRAEADKHKFLKPNAELACLIREKFTNKEIAKMGLWAIVVMHEPIDSGGAPVLLRASRRGDGRWLDAYVDRPGDGWDRDYGFAFAVSPQ